MNHIILRFFMFFCYFTSKISAQQKYTGNSVLDCGKTDETGPSPDFLYTCNTNESSWRAFLIFKSQPPYNSVSTISKLTSTNLSELAIINNVSSVAVFPTSKEVIVPVNCSCLGLYFQTNSSYVIPSKLETYYTIANYTYQGLAACNSLIAENVYGEKDLLPGLEVRVPLRCACPTSEQRAMGAKYLLTYSVYWGDNVTTISERFTVNRNNILDANGFSEYEPILYPFTTLLIPIPVEPSSSQTIIQPPQIVIPDRLSPRKLESKKGLYLGVGISLSSALLVLICVSLAFVFLHYRKKLHAIHKKKWVLPENLLVGIANADHVLRVFVYEELKVATNNFDSGSRMEGSVYCGALGGEVVVIKKVHNDLWKEAKILNKLNHFNLTRLYGVCEENGYAYLVFEYMENGCLRNWLSKKNCPSVQSWVFRVQIALDVANGLHYLHNFTDPVYVHKGIKSSNILLDGNLRAKIANFSLAISTETKEDGFFSSKFVDKRLHGT